MSFGIRVIDPNGNQTIVPATLDVQPQAWSGVDVGGMWDADIAVYGALEELAGLTAWLGYRIEIINGNGTAVWWGDVAAVEITAGGVRRGVSLDRLANRVQVRYAQSQPGGSAASADTAWADNALSQATYGVWERRISPPREMTAAEAEAYCSTALGTLAEPHYTLALDSGETQAHIYGTGYWQRARRRYYSQPAGLVEHVTSGVAAALGLGFTSNSVAFVARTDQIHSIAGYFANFQAGMRVRVSGAGQAGNNSSWEIDTGGDDRPAGTYTSTAVTFSPNDDIADANGGLGFLATDDVFTIAGTNDNNGTHLLDKAGAAAVEVSGSYHGGLVVSESAGDTVVFARGNLVKVTGSLVNEHVGNSVTVAAWGKKHYQPFTLPSNYTWTAAAIEIRLRRVGGPADNVTLQLVTDNAGVPGTVHETINVASDDIPTEMAWVSFALANTTTLTYGTNYGIVVSRSGSNSPTDYYEIDLDAGATYAGGALRQWDGIDWQTPNPAADMIFRVLGAVDTGTQAGTALQSLDYSVVDAQASGITSHQYRAGETLVLDEVTALLDMGTSGGLRLLTRVQRNLAAQVYARPDKSLARWTYSNGRLYDLFGQPAEEGFLPAGEWVHLGDAASLGPWARLSPVFVERAEWRTSGLSIEPEGGKDMYETGVRQG